MSTQITVLRSKIHNCTLTCANLHYVGSISIDRHLMDAVGLLPFEKVQVVDSNNGERLETYVIPAPAHSGEIQLNGAAARKGMAGDRLIIMSYVDLSLEEVATHQPKVALVDEKNQLVEVLYYSELLEERAVAG
jgi:aspartate 1-decarboxylase